MLPLYRTPLHVFNYDEIPPGYYYGAMQNGAAVQRFWHRKKFLAVADRIRDGERVLDLGCGPGSFLSILGETHPKTDAIGLDIASSQIDFASRVVFPRFGGRIRFQTHNVTDPHLPFPDASFDVITSIEVVEHIHPYFAYKTLEEAKRLLKPGGRILLTTPNYRSMWPVIELAMQKFSPVKYHEQHINKFTPNSLLKFLETLGLEVTDLRTLFIGAPFVAGLSWTLAQRILTAENLSKLRLGGLLIAEASPVRL